MPLPFTQFAPEELLTSWEEIENLFSVTGTELHSDHIEIEDEADFQTTLVHRATRHVFSYLGSRYKLADLATDVRIREIATYWAAFKLSQQRGNPSIFESEYIDGIEELERIREGTLYLGVPTTPRAVMQSGVVDLRASNYRLRPEFLGSSYIYPQQRRLRMYYWPFQWL
jgi:phage gp36-like protein